MGPVQMGQHHLSLLHTHPSLRERHCKQAISPPRSQVQQPLCCQAPLHLNPGAPAALTWRTGQCHVPEGCGSQPASFAGSALALDAPCSLLGETRGARMGPSGRGRRHCTCGAISTATRGSPPPGPVPLSGGAQQLRVCWRMHTASLAEGASGGDPAQAAAPCAPQGSQRTAL